MPHFAPFCALCLFCCAFGPELFCTYPDVTDLHISIDKPPDQCIIMMSLILLFRTCIHMNSAGARGTFAAHPYGPNGAITSGASKMNIIGDPCNLLPSTTTRNLQKARNIIKLVCFFIVLPDGPSVKRTALTFPFFIYLRLYEFCSIKDRYIAP